MTVCFQLCICSLTEYVISVITKGSTFTNPNTKSSVIIMKKHYTTNYSVGSEKREGIYYILYMMPLVPPMTFLIEDPISLTVSAGSFSG